MFAEKPHSELVKYGFVKLSGTNLLGYYARRVTIEHLEKLCVQLNCTSSDLFERHAQEIVSIAGNHALNLIKSSDKSENLTELIKAIHVEKLAQVDELLHSLQEQ